MNRQIFLITTIGIVLAACICFSGVLDAIVIFLLTGLLPGLNWSVPPNLMIFGFLAAAWLIFGKNIIANLQYYRALKKELNRQRRMPKKRFAPIQTAK